MTFIFIACVLLFAAIVEQSHAQSSSWFKSRPQPLRTFYVATIAEHPIRNGTKEQPMTIDDIETLPPQPGDLFLLTFGNYHTKLDLKAENSGNATHPIVIMSVAGERATIVGKVDIDSDYTWFIDVEITDPENKFGSTSALDVRGNHVRIINCLIHDTFYGHGIQAFPGAQGQVFYGNILYRTGRSSIKPDEDEKHAIQAFNAFETDGTKYIVGNLVIGYDDICEQCRGFSGHSNPDDDEWDTEKASGYHLEDNIFDNSHVVIGGYGPPSHDNIIRNNFFGESELQLGWAAPTQAEVTGNWIAWKYLDARYIWAQGDAAYGNPPKATIITNNHVLHAPRDGDIARNDDLPLIDVGTAQYVEAADKGKMGARPKLGLAPLNANDRIDENTYGGSNAFWRLAASGMKEEYSNISEWRSATRSAGAAFDVSSTLLLDNYTMPAKIVVQPNLYDAYRQYIAIFNFNNEEKVEVPITFPPIEGEWKVVPATDRYAREPTLTGEFPLSKIELNVKDKKFSTWIIIANNGADPNQVEGEETDPCPRFSTGCMDGDCAAMNPRCFLQELACNSKNKCVSKESAQFGVASTLTLSIMSVLIAFAWLI